MLIYLKIDYSYRMSKLLNVMRQGMKILTSGKGFDRIAAPVECISATDTGQCKFQWTVSEEQVNGFGTLHGGYTAYMVDFTTTAALMVMPMNKSGVSVDMSISYLQAAKVGEIVTMETECKKVGSTLAFMEAVLKNEDGKIIATGKHTKYLS